MSDKTIKQLANDPGIVWASEMDDTMLSLLSPISRAAALVSKKIISEAQKRGLK